MSWIVTIDNGSTFTDGCLLADPEPLELAVGAEALVLVAKRGRSGQ